MISAFCDQTHRSPGFSHIILGCRRKQALKVGEVLWSGEIITSK